MMNFLFADICLSPIFFWGCGSLQSCFLWGSNLRVLEGLHPFASCCAKKSPPVEFLRSVKVHLQLCCQCPTTCLELGALAQSGMKVAFKIVEKPVKWLEKIQTKQVGWFESWKIYIEYTCSTCTPTICRILCVQRRIEVVLLLRCRFPSGRSFRRKFLLRSCNLLAISSSIMQQIS